MIDAWRHLLSKCETLFLDILLTPNILINMSKTLTRNEQLGLVASYFFLISVMLNCGDDCVVKGYKRSFCKLASVKSTTNLSLLLEASRSFKRAALVYCANTSFTATIWLYALLLQFCNIKKNNLLMLFLMYIV